MTVEIVGIMVDMSDRTTCEWRSGSYKNGGDIPEGKEVEHQCTDVLWTSEEVNQANFQECQESTQSYRQSLLSMDKFNDGVLPNKLLRIGFFC